MRLAVSGVEDAALEELAARLHGATLVAYGTGESGPPSRDLFDAAAFLGPFEPELVEQARQLLSAGRHVLFAAHPSLNHDLLTGLMALAQQGGVRLAVMNPDRDFPSRKLVKQQLAAGKLGEVGLLRLHRWECSPIFAGYDTRLAPAAWRDLELVWWLTGRWPSVVYAAAHRDLAGPAGRGGQPGDPFLHVHLGYPGGAMALLDHYGGLPAGDGYASLSVIGAAGAAYADDQPNTQLLYLGGHPLALRTEEGTMGTAAMLQHFVDATRSDRSFSAELAIWRNVGAVADAVLRSLETRRAVQPEVL